MALDALVVIEQVAAAVQDQPSAIHLHAPGMVRGMPVHQLHAGPVRIRAGAGRGDAGRVQGGQGVREAGLPPVEHLVVGEHAAIERGAAQAGHVGRVHAVMDPLAGPGLSASRP